MASTCDLGRAVGDTVRDQLRCIDQHRSTLLLPGVTAQVGPSVRLRPSLVQCRRHASFVGAYRGPLPAGDSRNHRHDLVASTASDLQNRWIPGL